MPSTPCPTTPTSLHLYSLLLLLINRFDLSRAGKTCECLSAAAADAIKPPSPTCSRGGVDGHLIQTGGGQYCYPLDYGVSCKKHDPTLVPYCAGPYATSPQPDFCLQPWCYVDPSSCRSSETPYALSDFSFARGVGLPTVETNLHYSLRGVWRFADVEHVQSTRRSSWQNFACWRAKTQPPASLHQRHGGWGHSSRRVVGPAEWTVARVL